jgi:hypothetical protein
MRVLERRLRRLEVGLLPAAETAESRDLHQRVLEIRRRSAAHAAHLGIPEPEDVRASAFRPGMSLAETIIAARVRRPLPEAAGTVVGANGRARP